jgi:hypothetical protein
MRCWSTVSVETVISHPDFGIRFDAFTSKNVPRARHDCFDGYGTRVRSGSITRGLNKVYRRQLRGQWFVRCHDVVDLFISAVCYFRQFTSQQIDCVSAFVKSLRFRLIFLGKV